MFIGNSLIRLFIIGDCCSSAHLSKNFRACVVVVYSDDVSVSV